MVSTPSGDRFAAARAAAAPAGAQARILLLPGQVHGMQLAVAVPPDVPEATIPPADQLLSEFVRFIVTRELPGIQARAAQELLQAVQGTALPCAVDARNLEKLMAWRAGVNAVMQALVQQVNARLVSPPTENA